MEPRFRLRPVQKDQLYEIEEYDRRSSQYRSGPVMIHFNNGGFFLRHRSEVHNPPFVALGYFSTPEGALLAFEEHQKQQDADSWDDLPRGADQ